ncbi:MAG: hypothetical protein EHM58_00530 [Ignavibacteriae bacterium]|nr:MAG: hypothetical protein EHM58_00530 [Ignavibacteriota bacterium]
MSLIKFGNHKSSDGKTIPLKYGIFKWGEPNQFYILNNLLDYLPQYIERNPLCNAILKAIAIMMFRWQKAAINLKKFRLTGRTGLKFANENWKLLIKDTSSDEFIRASVADTYPMHMARGTKIGISHDIQKLAYDDNSWYKYYDYDKCGWWLDSTFPELSTDGYTYKVNKLTYLELDNMLFVEYYNRSRVTSGILEKLILYEAVPAGVNTTFLELKPFKIKFGTFKFGTRRFGEMRAPKQYLIGSN